MIEILLVLGTVVVGIVLKATLPGPRAERSEQAERLVGVFNRVAVVLGVVLVALLAVLAWMVISFISSLPF